MITPLNNRGDLIKLYKKPVVKQINCKLGKRSGKSAGAITAELIESR